MFKTFKSFPDDWIDKNCKAPKAFPNQKIPPCKCHSPVNFFDQKMDISISHRLRSIKILWMHFLKRLLVNLFSKKVIFKLGRRIRPFFQTNAYIMKLTCASSFCLPTSHVVSFPGKSEKCITNLKSRIMLLTLILLHSTVSS